MKSPFEKFSPRVIRIVFTACVLVIVGIVTVNFLDIMVYKALSNDQCGWLPRAQGEPGLLITEVLDDGVTHKAGVRDGDILLKINGIELQNAAHAMGIINPMAPGDFATYTVERDGVQFETQVEILKAVNMQYLAFVILGAGFLLVGYIVVMTKPQGAVQRVFGWYGIIAMFVFGLLVLNVNPATDPQVKFWTLVAGALLSRLLAVPMFVLFFLNFPVRYPLAQRWWFRGLIIFVGVLLTAPLLFVNQTSFPGFVLGVMGLSPLLAFIAGLIVFVIVYFRRVEKQTRVQLRPILIGALTGIASFIYVSIVTSSNPFILFTNPWMLSPGILIATVPVAFGYSIFRYRLMDIDLIIKRSLIYAAVTTSIAAIYILTVYGVGNLIAYFLGTEEDKVLSIIALVLIAFAFDPIKRRVQDGIDKVFYRERVNYQSALLEFSRELPTLINLDQILHSMVNRISTTMHVEKVAVVLCDEKEGCYSVSQGVDELCCEFDDRSDGFFNLLRHTHTPQSLALVAEEPESLKVNDTDKSKIIASGVVLAVPMFLKDKLIGTINVGPKMSGKVYSQEDIDLLTTVGNQAAIAVENARLHKSEVERQKIEEELSLARKIQQGLLPKANPTFPGLDVAGISIPARSVGGDYFDFIELSPKKLLVVVADVSGKGMSAALYMSKIQGMVQLAAHLYHSPKEMLVNVNRRIYDGIERKSFITMILGLFDMEKNEVRICRAGHNKALIGSNGDLRHLEGAGIGLGLERGPVFESKLEEVVQPLNRSGGSGLYVFYTDGVTETMNNQRADFGEERVVNLIKSNRNLSAHELQESVVRATEEFRGAAEQHDDLTLVVVKTS
ncbi:MAG: SpoIIE family protein phosphatase [Ignavibacteriae bacterium]|nr:SpoIIE family protein phosphatase [Ignavibacteriota bacterium]